MSNSKRKNVQTLSALIAVILGLSWSGLSLAKIDQDGLGISESYDHKKDEIEALDWYYSLDHAIHAALEERQMLLVLFLASDCYWCERVKLHFTSDPDINKLLSNFTLVEADFSEQRQIADHFGIQSVPTIVFLRPNGQEKERLEGFVDREVLKNKLYSVLSLKSRTFDRNAYNTLLDKALKNELPDSKWIELMLTLDNNQARREIHDRILNLTPSFMRELVRLLKDHRLAVRLGALEILEEITGGDFGFEPWDLPERTEANRAALTKWETWAEGLQQTQPIQAFTALTQKQLMRYLHDLVSQDRHRSVRANRKLVQAGESVLPALEDFIIQRSDLPPGHMNRVREVKYAVMISSTGSPLHENIAHRLIFGNLDIRLNELRQLEQLGHAAVEILQDFLKDRDPLVRETAVDTLIKAGDRQAIPVIESHIQHENDEEVIITILRGLGTLRSKRSLNLLKSYLDNPNEDLVITSLNSIANMKTKMAEEEIGKSLMDPRWRVRVAALTAIAELELTTLTDQVEALLHDEEPFVRYNAVKTFAAVAGKDSAVKLEKTFLKDDQMKKVVIDAYCSLDLKLPDSFSEVIDNSDVEIQFSVLESLKDCGERGLSLAVKLSKHENVDVACSAVRIIGKYGIEWPEYRKVMIDHLNSGKEPVVLAMLQSLRLTKYNRENLGLDSINYHEFGFQTADSDKDQEDEKDDPLDNIMQSFLGVTEDPSDDMSAPENSPPGPNEAETSVSDLFSSFLGQSDEQGGRSTPDKQTKTGLSDIHDLINAAKPYLTHEKQQIQLAAAFFLLSCGEMDGVDMLINNMEDIPIQHRVEIAGLIDGINGEKILKLAEKLIRDPSLQVRKAATTAILNNSIWDYWLDLLFDELSDQEAVLKVYDVEWETLDSLNSNHSFRKKLRNRIIPYLDEKDGMLKSLALFVLSMSWRRSDAELILPHINAESPWIRRAALYTMSRHMKDKFLEELAACVHDPSSYVREVIPDSFRKDSIYWKHYFSKEHFFSKYEWHSRRESLGTEALPAKAKEALEILTQDSSPRIRFKSMMALMTYFEKVDLDALVRTVNLFSGSTKEAEEIGRFLSTNFRRLGPEYSLLLPYLKFIEPSDTHREEVFKHFKKTTTSAEQQTYKMREGGNIVRATPATQEQALDAVPPKRYDVKLVLFGYPDCMDCREIEEMLDDFKNEHPSIMIEKYDMSLISGLRLNRAYNDHFQVSENDRGLTPAVFTNAGYLVMENITYSRLAELVHLSRDIFLPDLNITELMDEEKAKAQTKKGKIYRQKGLDSSRYIWFVFPILLLGGLIWLKRRK